MINVALLTLLLFYPSYALDYEIRYAAIIYRHGDRTPVDTYPTDPWRDESLWPVKFGELTNIGKMQHYKLGTWLKHRYLHFISEEFDPTTVHVRSTDVDRTLMSAQANLAGMFPPDEKSTWNTKLLWQPIPVHTVPELDDQILAMKKNCPAYNRKRMQFLNSNSYKKRLSQYHDLMNYLSKNTGKKIKDYEDISSIYSTLKIETLYNFTLPNWTEAVFPDKMKEPACYSFTTATATPAMARLMIGPLMQEITKQAMKVVLKKSPLKLSIYSGHDFTIGNILNGLGMFDGNCPAYTSTIFFEILESSDNIYVRISYRNSTEIIEPYVLNIPNCGELCPLNNFVDLYHDMIYVSWDMECNDLDINLILMFSALGIISMYLILKLHYQVFCRRWGECHSDEYIKSQLLLNRI